MRSIAYVMKEALQHYADGLAVIVVSTDGEVLHEQDNPKRLLEETDLATLAFCVIREVERAAFQVGNYAEVLKTAQRDFWKELAK